MNILAITPYTGSGRLVAMTEGMLESFRVCAMGSGAEVVIVAVNNAAERPIKKGLADFTYTMDKNEGFGNAINLAVRRELYDAPKTEHRECEHTHVLLLNNDLEFPYVDWLKHLVDHSHPRLVMSPCTDVTATKVAVADFPRNQDPIRADQVSAFCWMVPTKTIGEIRKRFGFPLFHPEFSNYGSDDVTGAVLRKLLGPKPFKVVPQAWVRHLKAQTANELGIKAGTKELLQRIANFKRARGLA